MARATIKDRITKSILRSNDGVFLRDDFSKFGGYDQVGRALREIVGEGKLVKVGYGVYARAKPSAVSGRPIPRATLMEIGLLTMEKLGVGAKIGQSAREYRDGMTTQIPMTTVISVGRARVSRRIRVGGRTLRYES